MNVVCALTSMNEPNVKIHHQHSKVMPDHLRKRAKIYVRVSNDKFLTQSLESQRYQYQLAETAEGMGWRKDQIDIIDDDLGRSGKNTENRPGFQTLIGAVARGEVGIIFSYEASRLARNNADWYQLLDLCSMFGTLIGNVDGIYNPHLFNDRIVLGLKGTMSEAEVHLHRIRLAEGRLNQVMRGEYRQGLPTGLERLPDKSVVKSPDKQVCDAIALVFEKFEELGSAEKVLRWFRAHKVELPRLQKSGPERSKVVFKPASKTAILDFLTNPAYAGSFAYGRRPARAGGGIGRLQQIERWKALRHGKYPAYITWDQFLANSNRLAANAANYKRLTSPTKGVPRDGSALLQGLSVCGHCGSKFRVIYTPQARYICTAQHLEYGTERCMSVSGEPIDRAVLSVFFDALKPAQIDAYEACLSKQEAERHKVDRNWQQSVKRAALREQQAKQRYDNVDPRNRLVADKLESDWEESLRSSQKVQDEYERFRGSSSEDGRVPEELKQRLQNVSAELPELWADSKLSNSQMKTLLRSLISAVVLTRLGADTIEARVIWLSRAVWTVQVPVKAHKTSETTGYEQVKSRIEELWRQRSSDEEIARRLTEEGFRSPRSTVYLSTTVQKIRLTYGWKWEDDEFSGVRPPPGYTTIPRLARQLGVSAERIYGLLRRGKIHTSDERAHRPSTTWLIKESPDLIAKLTGVKVRREHSA